MDLASMSDARNDERGFETTRLLRPHSLMITVVLTLVFGTVERQGDDAVSAMVPVRDHSLDHAGLAAAALPAKLARRSQRAQQLWRARVRDLERRAISSSRKSAIRPDDPYRSYRNWILADAAAADTHSVEHIRREIRHIQPGETISHLLTRSGTNAGWLKAWLTAVREGREFEHVRPGQTVAMDIGLDGNRLRRLALMLDDDRMVTLEHRHGSFVTEVRRIPYDKTLRFAAGRVVGGFAHSARKSGVPDAIVSQVADVLGWEVDLERDIENGALFRVAFEMERARPFDRHRPGRLVGVQIQSGARFYEAYYFPGKGDTPAGYYDREGRGLGSRFLRYPVEFTRIASRFSARRFHPVLKVPRPHYGVDFAAPAGTPVRAIADGVVAKAGWYGANGRLVRLVHTDGIESAYAHLSRIETGVTRGKTVRKGDTIGYVGSSGRATGPHLHFAVYRHGHYVDPLKLNPAPVAALRGRQRSAFFRVVAELEPRLAGLAPPREASPIQTAALVR